MITVPVFLDTNILLYAEDVKADAAKHQIANDLLRDVLRERTGYISMQVLHEYFSSATRKLRIDPAVVRERVVYYMTMDIVLLEPHDFLAAIDIHRLYQFSIWDALILRAALISGCRRLYTEDLQHGFRLERLEVVNPFREPPSEPPFMIHDR